MQRLVATLALALALDVAHASLARAEAPGESPKEIDLVTMGVGSLIWERHGHIALCVQFENQRYNRCYNYGIADFQHPLGMTLGFFRGTHSFWVGPMDVRGMLQIYIDADRSIWRQPLPLTDEQMRKVLNKLEDDVLEEHKYYAYDHFDDNCTTRIRDIIDDVTDHALSKMTEPTDGRTYRDLAREGFFGMRVPLLVTDIAMGRSTDRVPSYYERMFLPQYLREAVEKRFGVKPLVVYERRGPPAQTDGPSGRFILALVILALCAPAALARWRGRFQRTGLAIAVVPYALLGFVLLVLAIISPLPYVRWNETILVWLPADFLLLFLRPPRREKYARGRVAMLGVLALLMIFGVLVQPLWAPLLWPLVPNAIVGFWPAKWTRSAAAEDDSGREQKAPVKTGGGRHRRARAAARR